MRLSLAALACTLASFARAGEGDSCHHPEAAPAQTKAKGQASDGWVLTRGEKLQGAAAVPALSLAKLSEATARHYASEGAIVPRGQDGKAREVQLIASGVELRR